MANPVGFAYPQIQQFFKIMFSAGNIQPLSMKDSPLRARMGAGSDVWGGSQVRSIPMRYALPSARSRTAQTAINERITSSALLAQWQMQVGEDYATFRVQYGDILRAREDKMAFARLQQFAVASTVEVLNDSVNRALYRDGTGSMATISATASTSVLGINAPGGANSAAVLTNAADAYLFEIGSFYQFFNSVNANNQPNLLNGGESRKVLAIDTENGYVFFDNSLALIPSLAAGTLILQQDDGVGYGSSQVDPGALVGLQAYLPLLTPQTGDNLWSQDRSLFPVKLAGHRVDARGKNLWEEVMRMIARIRRFKGNPTVGYMAPEQLQNMLIGQNALTETFRSEIRAGGDNGRGEEVYVDVGFTGVRVITPGGTVEFFGDPFCPPDRVYLLQEDTWHLNTMGEFPHLVTMGNVDGLLQEQDDYALQGRLYAAGQTWTDAPAYNGVLQVTPVY